MTLRQKSWFGLSAGTFIVTNTSEAITEAIVMHWEMMQRRYWRRHYKDAFTVANPRTGGGRRFFTQGNVV